MSWNKIFSRLAASVLLALAFGAWGADFCVDNAADFQNALTSAETNGQADRIKLVQGTYNGHFVYDSAEAQAPEILGGYSAGCTSRTLDPANTELNGGGTGTVLAVTASLGADFTLEGVTLSGGDAASIGGGLHVVSQSDVTLNENIVSANSAGADGGGAYLETTSRVTLTGNRFTGNTNDGLYVDAPFVTLTDNQVDTNTSKGAEIQAGNGIVELTDNAFTANTEEGVNLYSDTAVLQGNHFENNDGDEAYLRGELVATNNHFDRNGQDGIEVVGGSGFTLTDNSFSFNLETGAYFNVYNHGDVTLIGNDFEGNLARGAYVYVGIKDATLTDNRFIDNQVASSNHGGGAYVYGGTSTLTNNRFAGNTAGGHGGGVYVYGGTTTLVNNGFNGNQSADHGGGAYLDRGTATLTNNSFANNKALHGAGLGISLYYETQGADLYNNPFWNNAATLDADDLWIENDGDGDSLPSPLVLMHNDFDWSQVVVTLPITIDPSNLNDVNPHFSDAALHLSSTSAVIDAGDDGAPALPATDMDGDARIIGAHVDIGADEYNGSPPTQHTLTVDKLGTGGGTVTSNPAGIDCGTTCSATFGAGDTVKLTAAPDPSSTFAGWSGACSGTGDCTVTMNRDLTVTATFDLPTQTHTLTINKDGTGDGIVTSDPQGIDCDPDCSEAFGAGDTVKLTAAPDPSSTFVGWSGACSGTGDCPVTMNSDLTVTATFDRIRHTLTVEKKGSGSGTVVSSGGVIDCGSTCSATFDHGQSVDLTASADNGSVFAGWSGCDADNGNVCSVVMNSDRLVTATFTDSTPTPCATMTIHQTDTSSCPDLRTILSIQDAQGQPVTGLTESNFLCSADQPYLEEDGMCQRVQLETGGSLAVSLVIDKSGSLSATDLDNIRQACIDFINLLSPGDSVAVYQFDSAVRLLQDYTTDLTLAIDAVNSIPAPGGSTALYDAIFAAAEHAEAASSRKGLVVLTDGQDNASLYTIDEAIERSIAAGVPVFTIGFGSADPVVLTEIADQTGGLYYDGVTSADLQDLLSRLGAVLSNQYVLLWDTAFPDGGVHSITVEAHWDSCTVSETATYDQAGSPCGASCMAERTLPMGYAAGSPAPVALAVRPDVDVQTYALEDIPPTGMAVSNISSGGLLDNGKVKWGPFFDNVDRDLSYEVTPPFSTQGSIGWGGVFSHDGIGEAICGDTLLPECPVHPADLGVSGDNWRIEINELTAYTTAWKLGDSWPRPPSPIPLSYAVNAGYLWQNGEDYHCDPFLDPPWDAGVTASSIQHMQGFVEAAQGSSHAVSSFDPDYYTPGIPVDVTLAVSPPASTQAYGVEETPPEGWAVTNISHNGTFNAQSNQIRWGIFDDDTPRDLTYRVTPPDSAVDAQSFFGQAAFDQQTELIGGQRTLLPSPCAGETLHIHDVTIPSGDDLVCSATESITLGPSVELESGSGLELQAGWGVTFSAPVHVRQGAALYIYTTTAP